MRVGCHGCDDVVVDDGNKLKSNEAANLIPVGTEVACDVVDEGLGRGRGRSYCGWCCAAGGT